MERGKASAETIEQFKESSSSLPPPPPPWIDLPPEITADILRRLGAEEILNSAKKVCTTWWKVSKDPSTWRAVNMSCQAHEDIHIYKQKLRMFQEAVDRSQGQVIHIKVTDLDIQSYDLIAYISEQCSQLKCLALEFCGGIYAPIHYVIEAVKKLPLLESFHLEVINASSYSFCELIETAGNSCHALNSLTLSRKQLGEVSDGWDEVAAAVAKWMPQLRHLALACDFITGKGLTEILVGCTKLESLDLRRCSEIRVDGELLGRCSLQIRDLRLRDGTEPAETASELENGFINFASSLQDMRLEEDISIFDHHFPGYGDLDFNLWDE